MAPVQCGVRSPLRTGIHFDINISLSILSSVSGREIANGSS